MLLMSLRLSIITYLPTYIQADRQHRLATRKLATYQMRVRRVVLYLTASPLSTSWAPAFVSSRVFWEILFTQRRSGPVWIGMMMMMMMLI
ncbi:hypothetical protein M426DRAFT_158543 [Hypoxylon sp. CI-4A]|nr:hypothetical protein M426DRAFT_158543 [Hypoxylon sp. CI-4A]